MPNEVKIALEAVNNTEHAFNSLKTSATGAFDSIQKSLGLIKLDAIVNLGRQAYQLGETMLNGAKGVATQTMEIQRQSQILGISTDAYQKLAYAANMSDVSAGDLSQGLKILSRNMEEASRGTGQAKEYLDAMGIAVREADGGLRPLIDVMGDIADRFQGWQDGPRKIAIALELFGRSAEALVPLLNQGKSGMAAYAAEAQNLGSILGESAVKKGAETEDAFKRINAQILAIKANSGPAVLEILKLAEAASKWIKERSGFSEDAAEKELKNLENQVDYNIKLGSTYEKQIPNLERIVKLQDELGKLGPPKWVKEWVEGFKPAEKLQPPEIAPPPEPGWIKKWVEQFDDLQHAFDQLGIESQESLAKAAAAAETYMRVIEKKFQEGKGSIVDYKNALAAATAAMQKLVPPNTTQQITDLWNEYNKAVKAIPEDDPNRAAKVQELLDQVFKQIKAIEGPTVAEMKAAFAEMKTQAASALEEIKNRIDQNPIRAGVDVTEIKKIEDAYKAVKSKIEATPIKINVDSSALGGGAGQSESEAPAGIDLTGIGGADYTVDFLGRGSRTLPLSEKIQELIAEFGGLGNAIQGMQAMIDFSEMTTQLQGLQRQLANVREVTQFYLNVHREFPNVNTIWSAPWGWLSPAIQDWIAQRQADIESQMGLTQLKMIMSLLQGFGGSLQTGGPVERTGLYLLHKGEEVRTTNQVSMGGITLIQHIQGGGNVRETADAVAKALKYAISGELRDTLKKLR